MKTDPTSSIAGPAGMSLSYHAIQSGRDLANQAKISLQSKDAISDTLETTDREGDGRLAWELESMALLEEALNQEASDRLDLQG
ncbi:MAG: hypothetical protein ACI87E_003953 [Mariniblastus sp.]|jgi:hypothetical protein